MTKRLLHCRCCGQLSPAEYNCCPKYHNAMAEITELKKEAGYSVCDLTEAQWQDAQNEVAELKNKVSMLEGTRLKYSDSLKVDAIREMMNACGYGYIDNGSFVCHHINLSDITRYINKLEDK